MNEIVGEMTISQQTNINVQGDADSLILQVQQMLHCLPHETEGQLAELTASGSEGNEISWQDQLSFRLLPTRKDFVPRNASAS